MGSGVVNCGLDLGIIVRVKVLIDQVEAVRQVVIKHNEWQTCGNIGIIRHLQSHLKRVNAVMRVVKSVQNRREVFMDRLVTIGN